MLSFRLFLEDDTIGALNLYSRKVQAFDEHNRAEQLDHALVSNREIGMAMGVLMDQERMTQEQAFAVLRGASQHLNRKLHDVAAELVEAGRLPQRSASPEAPTS